MTDDLRTALTKLAEAYGSGDMRLWAVGEELRDLLDAHPTEPQAGSLAEYRDAVARNRSAASWMRDDFLTDMDEWMTTHPASASDTRREDVARALWPYPHAFESALAEHKDYYLDKADAVLAVLPAPPVVDVDVIREFIVDEVGFDNGVGMTDQAQRLAARLRGATRGDDD